MFGSGKIHCQTCGMEVDPAKMCRTEIGEKVYYFCRAGFKASFKRAYFNRTKAAPANSKKSSKKGGGSCH